ncbi:sigma-70 family RNA polymerase sigma factor [Haloimpatiens sp. FM7330]|uniref:sigma-70 family RNA polymerase sigma factor n=1 Tax=Haloimpatiens sp. FM7330 TaxID=3298610 RepID=UPI0036329301
MKINENNFLIELKKKNPKALEYTISIYANLVFKVVINILGTNNMESAKECVNDVYLLIWDKINLYNPEKSSFKNWLLAISKYKAIDFKRSISKNNINVPLENQLLYDELNIEDEIITKEKKKELFELLNSLNKKDKEIFIRKYFLDENIESIAKSLSSSKGAIYNRLWRGKHTLANKLNTLKSLEVLK